MSDIRYPAVGDTWTYINTQQCCFFSDKLGFGFEDGKNNIRYFISLVDWEDQFERGLWTTPKRVSDVLCFYVTPTKTIKATFYGDKNATGKPYYLELFDDGSLNVREA